MEWRKKYGFTLLHDAEYNEIDGGILESDDWQEEDFVVRESLELAGCANTYFEITKSFLE